MRARCSSGAGSIPAIRTRGSTPVGQAGGASPNVTDTGVSSAALPRTTDAATAESRRVAVERVRDLVNRDGPAAHVERERTDHHVGRTVGQCRRRGRDVVIARSDALGHNRPGGPAQYERRPGRHVPAIGSR